MERLEEELIRRSEPESLVSVTVGRFMSTLLSARPKKLRESVSRLSPDSQKGSSGSIDEALWFLEKCVRDAAQRDEAMGEILVPIIEHTLRFKDSKHGNPAMILLNWLFQDEVLFQALSRNLSNIISRNEDRILALGWCLLIRRLVECDDTGDQSFWHGIREKHSMFVEIVSSCVPHLSIIVRDGSILQDGYEVPSRLSLSAADCLLSITGALAKRDNTLVNRPKPSTIMGSHQPVALIPHISEKKKKQSFLPEDLNIEANCILWNHLEDLTRLVQCLFAGLSQVLKWLIELKEHHGGSQKEAGTAASAGGALLLSSCWRHYSVLLHMEDQKFPKISKELLEQYLSGIKGKKFECILSEYGMKLVPCLLHQLRSNNEEISEDVVAIFKAVIFKLQSQSGDSFSDTMCMDVVIPSLLHLLDERDGAAKAVSVLLADYCSNEILQRLVSGTSVQRLNSMDVISEVILMSKDSFPSHIHWKEIADCLLKCLGDEETCICKQTSELLKLIEPSFVLPDLVTLIYASNGKVHSSATGTLLGVLKHYNEDSDVICMLLTCLSNIQALDTSESNGHSTEGCMLYVICGKTSFCCFPSRVKHLSYICTIQNFSLARACSSSSCTVTGSTFDSDRVLKMIPEWAKSVQNWDSLIGPLLDKMFLEPSNAIIVRFLSCISEYLADTSDLVLPHVLSHMKKLNKVDESFISRSDTKSSVDKAKSEKSLFDHLCPLLILRLLPQRVFDDIDSSTIYGKFLSGDSVNDYQDIKFEDCQCIAAFILERAFSKFEFEEVRKLSAELCGRLHPQVLFPTVLLQLEKATELQDSLKIKACLFSICTSLVVRGWESFSHSVTPKIRKVLENILLWPSVEDEISKVQHGCIDCLALMICAELQDLKSLKTSGGEQMRTTEEDASGNSVLDYTIHCLVEDRSNCSSIPKLSTGENPLPIPFRLCMANVIISACQKIPESTKKTFARKALPPLVHSLKVISVPEVRAACIQVLFSAMYYLKSTLLPVSSDLLKLSLRFLEQGSEKEKLAGAKLMASLMASEDMILENISEGLLEARSVLSKASLSDPSQDVREVCAKLLACITPL
ncbi:binding protein [Arabidopsis lyrata subsp. lyrata]|uniref:Binding protein n=1 Tax=Arabidopsis lyrata subsp. lyrata TaxID=81972 RepID=D7LVU5_ARALL|nr:binding protein [Arabidopsis lyrata subsp. lyrata]